MHQSRLLLCSDTIQFSHNHSVSSWPSLKITRAVSEKSLVSPSTQTAITSPKLSAVGMESPARAAMWHLVSGWMDELKRLCADLVFEVQTDRVL